MKYQLPFVYSFSLCCTDVIAPKTDNLFTRDLMFDAVPNSSASILLTLDIWSFGGMINEIILVPFLQRQTRQPFIYKYVAEIIKRQFRKNLLIRRDLHTFFTI